MSYKGKTYSKKGGGGKGNPFERMMKEQCNKPVAAKSAGIVGESGRGGEWRVSKTDRRSYSEGNQTGPVRC